VLNVLELGLNPFGRIREGQFRWDVASLQQVWSPGSDMGSDSISGICSNMVSDPGSVPSSDSTHFPLPVSLMASSEAGWKQFYDNLSVIIPQVHDPVDLGRGSETPALGPQVSLVMGSLEGRILPSSSLEEPTSKPLIQYKRKGRKPKSVVGQGKLEDVGFLRRGFLESSSSFLPQVDRGFSGRGCSNRAHPLNSTGGL
jgi:hypothetical protein